MHKFSSHLLQLRAPLAFAALPLAFLLNACGDSYRYITSGEVGRALKKELRDNRATQVDIARLTDFEWDEFILAGPYEPAEDICKRLRIAPTQCHKVITTESLDDGEIVMLFRHNGKVVHIEKHFRFHGDFTPIPNESFTRKTAVFNVSVDGKSASGQSWLKLTAARVPNK